VDDMPLQEADRGRVLMLLMMTMMMMTSLAAEQNSDSNGCRRANR